MQIVSSITAYQLLDVSYHTPQPTTLSEALNVLFRIKKRPLFGAKIAHIDFTGATRNLPQATNTTTYPLEEDSGPVEVPPSLKVAGLIAEGFRAAGVCSRRLPETQ